MQALKHLLAPLGALLSANAPSVLTVLAAVLGYLWLNKLNRTLPVGHAQWPAKLLDRLVATTQKGAANKWSWPVFGKSLLRGFAQEALDALGPDDPTPTAPLDASHANENTPPARPSQRGFAAVRDPNRAGFVRSRALRAVLSFSVLALLLTPVAMLTQSCAGLSGVGINVTGGQNPAGGWQAGVDITIGLTKSLVLPVVRSMVDSGPAAAARTPAQEEQVSRAFAAAARALDEADTLTHTISGASSMPEQCRLAYALTSTFNNLEGVLRVVTAATPAVDPMFAAALGALASKVDSIPTDCASRLADAGVEAGPEALMAPRARVSAQQRLRAMLVHGSGSGT